MLYMNMPRALVDEHGTKTGRGQSLTPRALKA
jgi:hypothetical protein